MKIHFLFTINSYHSIVHFKYFKDNRNNYEITHKDVLKSYTEEGQKAFLSSTNCIFLI